jgi:hypothetical protein
MDNKALIVIIVVVAVIIAGVAVFLALGGGNNDSELGGKDLKVKIEVGDYIEYKETHNWDNSIHTHRYTVKSIDGEAVAVLVQETGETEHTDTMTREEFLLYIAPSLTGFSENGKSTIDTAFGTIKCAKYTQKEAEDSVDMYLGKDGVLYKKEFIQKNFDESLHITIFDLFATSMLV